MLQYVTDASFNRLVIGKHVYAAIESEFETLFFKSIAIEQCFKIKIRSAQSLKLSKEIDFSGLVVCFCSE